MKRLVLYVLLAIIVGTGTLPAQIEASPVSGAYHFGFKKSQNGQLPSIDQEGFKAILEQNDAIFLGDTKQKELYLTFDNGYENGFTPAILDVLRDKKVPAAFFVTGHYLKDQSELVKRMAAEGHVVGNHSWSHPDMTRISNDKIRTELDQVKSEINRLTGQQVSFLRPPRGIFNARTLAESRAQGYVNVFWSVAYKDWDTNVQRGADYARQQVLKQLHPGAVILLHSVSKDNTEALGSIIDEARRQGYVFKHLNDLKTKSY
ncbi:delta-lactam-biosynthetic de-N-acetylase [Paenibacillus xylanexedens]|uniref:delta-lactam-biosynthetic de-N-acetylase n=1 Tax=Paenibacillus xylanexedens TaxID=528191 RepID=UPI00119F9159|nr:delta-lactam-biosynthetic de-N-acetylase [Paenibacillus xylanexedens]